MQDKKNFTYDFKKKKVIVIFNLLVLGKKIINHGKFKRKFQLKFLKYEDLLSNETFNYLKIL